MIKDKITVKREQSVEKSKKHIPLRKYTWGGRISCLMALANIIAMMFNVFLSYSERGHAGMYVGLIMFCVLISAMVAFVIGVNSFCETDKFLRYSYIGTIANAIIWIGIFFMYLAYI